MLVRGAESEDVSVRNVDEIIMAEKTIGSNGPSGLQFI